MTPSRFPLSILMAGIGLLAVGLGAMRAGSEMANRIASAVVFIALLIALLGAIVRRGEGAWVGFALFGGAYALLAFLPSDAAYGRRINPAAGLVEGLATALHPGPGPEPPWPRFNPTFESMIGDPQNVVMQGRGSQMNAQWRRLLSPAELTTLDAHLSRTDAYQARFMSLAMAHSNAAAIGHALFALVFGLIGSALGRALERPRRPADYPGSPGWRAEGPAASTPPAGP